MNHITTSKNVKQKIWAENNKDKTANYKRKYKNKNKREIREFVKQFKQGKSCNCGESRFYCLDFHHPDKENKKDTIANLVRQSYCKATILAEIEKCEIICSNCHRSKHFTGKSLAGKKRKHIHQMKIGGCVDCKMSKPECLDFHHIDPTNKKFGIGESSRRKDITLDDLVLELEKCELLCSNCHKHRHFVSCILSHHSGLSS